MTTQRIEDWPERLRGACTVLFEGVFDAVSGECDLARQLSERGNIFYAGYLTLPAETEYTKDGAECFVRCDGIEVPLTIVAHDGHAHAKIARVKSKHSVRRYSDLRD